jgi:DNA-binding IclR family transcriptional regulator
VREQLPGAQTVARVTALLDLFSPERTSLSVAETAALLALPRSTVHRLLAALRLSGYLRQDASTARYHIGARTLYLARLYDPLRLVGDVARTHLRQLSDAIGESTALFVREGDYRYAIDAYECDHKLRIVIDVGERLPLGRGAAGHVLRMSAAQARGARVTVTRGERVSNAWGIASPVFDRAGELIGALEAHGPLDRITPARERRYAALVSAAAAKLTRDIGGAAS